MPHANPAEYIIALDLDGTLLRDDKSVSSFTKDTLARLSRCGARIFFTTGRHERAAKAVLSPFSFSSWALMSNGVIAHSLPEHMRFFAHYIPTDLVCKTIEALRAYAYPPLLIIDPDRQNGSAERDIVMDASLLSRDIYARMHAEDTHVIVTDFSCDTGYTSRVVGMFLWELPEKIPGFMTHISAEIGDALETRPLDNLLYTSAYRILEMVEAGWTKWNGICSLRSALDADICRVIAYGDDYNDIDMLTHADVSFAPSTAIPAVKEIAHEVIASHEEDGVARSLRAFFQESF